MGAHKGWRIEPRAGGKFLARVRLEGGYRSRTFLLRNEAVRWAETSAAEAKVASGRGMSLVLGACPVADARRAYERGLESRGRGVSHRKQVTQALDALAAVAPDLASPRAPIAIESWLDGLGPAKRNRALTLVRGFCRWCMRRGLLPRDPTLAIDRASREERVRAQFTIDDLRAMLTAQLADASPEYHRLVALLAYTGMRFREAALARWEDIDWSGRCILVRVGPGRRVKRNRERLIPLQDELAAVLEPHRQEAGPLTQGQEWNPTRGFRSYLKRAGVAVDGRSPHSLRHTYAGIMTATGVPAQLLMAYLGHSSAATMLRYTRLAARFVAVTEREKWQRGEIRICKQGAIRSGDVSREQI